jgi:[ribosomal protein S18]-alanine N-acetyltransferase
MSADHRTAVRSIRKFSPEDAAALEAIAKLSPETAQWSLDTYARLCDQGQQAWVAESGGVLCGFLVGRMAADEAEILNVAVDPAKRRSGIASALLNAALADFRHAGALTVFLEVRESNHAAIRFYENRGFAKTGRRPGYYQRPTEEAVLMMRELTG